MSVKESTKLFHRADMNLIRTIQASETQQWIDLLFVRGPHNRWVRLHPHRLPSPCHLCPGLVGSRAYLGYGRHAAERALNQSRLRHVQHLAAPQQVAVLGARRLGKRRSLDLTVQPDERLVRGTRGAKRISTLTSVQGWWALRTASRAWAATDVGPLCDHRHPEATPIRMPRATTPDVSSASRTAIPRRADAVHERTHGRKTFTLAPRSTAGAPPNTGLQQSACLLRGRRCRPLAARTAAAETHVRLA